MNEQGLRTYDDAAKYLSISVRHLYRLIASGEIEGVKIGRSSRVRQVSLDAYIDRLVKESSERGNHA